MIESDLESSMDDELSYPSEEMIIQLDAAGLSPLEVAILKTIAYSDIFDYPLLNHEIHRYLIEFKSSKTSTFDALIKLSQQGQPIECNGGFYSLSGRGEIVKIRARRRQRAQILWSKAGYFGRVIASLPNVLMVSVTGSLAVDNADQDSDIDYLIVTRNNRLWTTRAMTVLIVRLAAQRGISLCPNYLVTERAMTFHNRNLYTAHEIVQMEPVAGIEVYQKLREKNAWVKDYLPNAAGAPAAHPNGDQPTSARLHLAGRGAEFLLNTPPGGWIESWEMNRKIQKLTKLEMGDETGFTSDSCKGHFENQGHYALEKFNQRWMKVAEAASNGDAN